MALAREHGTCCLILPLKFGVGLITMFIFTMSLVHILALFTGDIRFQGNGYALWVYNVPSVVGSLGLVFGFIGLLGTYDDKPSWMFYFVMFYFVKIAFMILAAFFDYRVLRQCDSWLNVDEHLKTPNPQLEVLAQNNVCPWARWSYLLGTSLDIGFNIYLFLCVYSYYRMIILNPPYPIDFGNEKYDVAGRWKQYQVKDPRGEYAMREPKAKYEEPELVKQVLPNYGTVDAEAAYGPDGMQQGEGAPLFTSAGQGGGQFSLG